MKVLDASAILAYLRGEPGAEIVKQALADGAVCSAANWSEVMQKALQHGDNWGLMRQLLEGYALVVEPVTQADAEWAATYWQTHPQLSLADRLCLALAQHLATPVLTADTAWGQTEHIHQIR